MLVAVEEGEEEGEWLMEDVPVPEDVAEAETLGVGESVPVAVWEEVSEALGTAEKLGTGLLVTLAVDECDGVALLEPTALPASLIDFAISDITLESLSCASETI